VIGTQQGGKSEIRSCGRIFVGISGIGFSAFPLTRGRTLHIRSTEIAKREEIEEVRFGISANRSSGIRDRGDIRLGSRVSNSRYLNSRNRGGGC
jgi:hypothetical protein